MMSTRPDHPELNASFMISSTNLIKVSDKAREFLKYDRSSSVNLLEWLRPSSNFFDCELGASHYTP